jgi:hypothetical protein
MNISISVTFAFGEIAMAVTLDIPTSDLSANNPVKFIAKQVKDASKDKNAPTDGQQKDTGEPVMEVAIGSADAVYIAVSPPQSILEQAKVTDVIKNLRVMVNKGNYADGAFPAVTTGSIPEQKKAPVQGESS